MVRLDEIVARFGGDLVGNGGILVRGVATLESAEADQLGFLSNSKYQGQLAVTRAAAVILGPEARDACPVAAIVTAQPYLYFARVAQWFNPPPRPAVGVHPSAVVETVIPASVSVGPHAWIGAGASIGENTVVGAGCAIGENARIGAGSWLHPRVTVAAGCRIGERAIVHSGAVIGSDGFGFARDAAAWVKIPQTGRVVVGDDVEIGANTTIDRGALEDTVIGDGVKLDNQIQVAHNVHIGANTAMAGCVGIAGSAKVGAGCTVGGGAIILGHIELADGVHVSAGTLVSKSIATPGSYTGTVPFMAHADWLKNFSRLRHLDAMADKIRALEMRLAELENR
ncbi:MAG: UDP-3-O-(3-hydroxymyristoyl)glucosamine N-acyltransferase [Gammaproteobacteria bacterium]|nr:UDP-3-O-(3-hydroxymyristoyl)glucosamine N-acyltransferase [Gammaproteobacteria bacterium]MBU1647492.1 UDP-3-O-(3-hydroxymyristoyl)glucosamine N-acyltransferase [Gammaproteobacteria bacterium]MBU1972941.1 UDP-3-O-(3-hydroxymyristoyl)glucosamine N-acyltransferase [Gammaproteobacteria bacterium]